MKIDSTNNQKRHGGTRLKDTDELVHRWLREGAPMGISQPIGA